MGCLAAAKHLYAPLHNGDSVVTWVDDQTNCYVVGAAKHLYSNDALMAGSWGYTCC